MALPFVPKLPTWNTTFANWIFNPATGERELGAGFSGQLYPPFRSSDNVGPSDAYVVYPKTVLELHDPAEYDNLGNDAIITTWQGITWGFVVVQVLPRWANFPNEHFLALLRRMTAAELADPAIVHGSDFMIFPTEVLPVLYQGEGAGWIDGDPIMCQVRHPELTMAPGTMFNDLLLLYSAADNVLTDPRVFNLDPFEVSPPYGDVARFTWPTSGGSLKSYWVIQVSPRRLGFPDEHIVARLRELTSLELLDLLPIDPGLSSIVADPDEITDDDISTSTITVTYLGPGGEPLPGRAVTITTTGAGTIDDPTGETDDDGIYETTYHSGTAETCTFSTAAIGPSNVLTVATMLLKIDISGITAGTCADCGTLDNDYAMPDFAEVGGPDNLVSSDSFAWTNGCDADQFVLVEATFQPSTGNLQVIFSNGGGGVMATYFDTVLGWNMIDVIVIPLDSSDGRCNWPATLAIGEML